MQRNTVLLVSALILGMCIVATADPFHAQCKVIWLFGIPCRDVFIAIVNQIKAWTTLTGCLTGGEKCLYELQSVTPYLIVAKHTSRRWRSVQDLSYELVPSETAAVCRVIGMSVSETWNTLIDNGTNYCTLYNLIEGSGLVNAEGYKEYTNEWICLEHSTANCTEY